MSKEKYSKGKKKAKIIGKLLLIFGIILIIGGIVTFSLSIFLGPTMDMDFEEFGEAMELSGTLSFLGIGLIAGGGFMAMFGGIALYISHMGKITSYVAEEISPAATKMTGAVIKGVHEGGGIKIQMDDASKQKIMIKCRNCGELNEEDDVFCSKCGEKL